MIAAASIARRFISKMKRRQPQRTYLLSSHATNNTENQTDNDQQQASNAQRKATTKSTISWKQLKELKTTLQKQRSTEQLIEEQPVADKDAEDSIFSTCKLLRELANLEFVLLQRPEYTQLIAGLYKQIELRTLPEITELYALLPLLSFPKPILEELVEADQKYVVEKLKSASNEVQQDHMFALSRLQITQELNLNIQLKQSILGKSNYRAPKQPKRQDESWKPALRTKASAKDFIDAYRQYMKTNPQQSMLNRFGKRLKEICAQSPLELLNEIVAQKLERQLGPQLSQLATQFVSRFNNSQFDEMDETARRDFLTMLMHVDLPYSKKRSLDHLFLDSSFLNWLEDYFANAYRLQLSHIQMERLYTLYRGSPKEVPFLSRIFRKAALIPNIIVHGMDKIQRIMFEEAKEVTRTALQQLVMLQSQYPRLFRQMYFYNRLLLLSKKVAQVYNIRVDYYKRLLPRIGDLEVDSRICLILLREVPEITFEQRVILHNNYLENKLLQGQEESFLQQVQQRFEKGDVHQKNRLAVLCSKAFGLPSWTLKNVELNHLNDLIELANKHTPKEMLTQLQQLVANKVTKSKDLPKASLRKIMSMLEPNQIKLSASLPRKLLLHKSTSNDLVLLRKWNIKVSPAILSSLVNYDFADEYFHELKNILAYLNYIGSQERLLKNFPRIAEKAIRFRNIELTTLLMIYHVLNYPQPNAEELKLLGLITQSLIFQNNMSMIVYECLRLLKKEQPQLSFLKSIDKETFAACEKKRKIQTRIPQLDEVLTRIKFGGIVGSFEKNRTDGVDYIIGGQPYAVRLKRHKVLDSESGCLIESGEFKIFKRFLDKTVKFIDQEQVNKLEDNPKRLEFLLNLIGK